VKQSWHEWSRPLTSEVNISILTESPTQQPCEECLAPLRPAAGKPGTGTVQRRFILRNTTIDMQHSFLLNQMALMFLGMYSGVLDSNLDHFDRIFVILLKHFKAKAGMTY
jgi:hypothetical protein